jgi:hypothetical protein
MVARVRVDGVYLSVATFGASLSLGNGRRILPIKRDCKASSEHRSHNRAERRDRRHGRRKLTWAHEIVRDDLLTMPVQQVPDGVKQLLGTPEGVNKMINLITEASEKHNGTHVSRLSLVARLTAL